MGRATRSTPRGFGARRPRSRPSPSAPGSGATSRRTHELQGRRPVENRSEPPGHHCRPDKTALSGTTSEGRSVRFEPETYGEGRYSEVLISCSPTSSRSSARGHLPVWHREYIWTNHVWSTHRARTELQLPATRPQAVTTLQPPARGAATDRSAARRDAAPALHAPGHDDRTSGRSHR